jgi:hypothetical protein
MHTLRPIAVRNLLRTVLAVMLTLVVPKVFDLVKRLTVATDVVKVAGKKRMPWMDQV